MISFILMGQPFSKANSRRLVNFGGRPRFIKSEKALQYEEEALWQLKIVMRGLETFTTPVGVLITIHYPDRRQDLDPSLILDIMQKAGVYTNDRLVEEMHLFRKIDKLKPRSEVSIWSLDE